MVKQTKRKPSGAAAKGAGPGRPKGSANKTTTLLKDAILKAAELEGEDGNGKDGLIGYCRSLARDEKKAFASLMGRVLPTQIEGTGEGGFAINIVRFSDGKQADADKKNS